MLKRLDWSDRSAVAAIVLGVAAAFLPWYAYSAGTAHVSVDGFRASVFGDLFYLLIAAEALLLLMRHGVVVDVLGGVSDRSTRIGVASLGTFALVAQLVLLAAAGRGAGIGMLAAVFAVVLLALAACARTSDAEPRRTVREMLGEELPD